jgi:transcriptional regulator with XRE-family HTH domain
MTVENAHSHFARLVGKVRQQRHMSQGQLAQATRLSRTYIYHLENSMRNNPSRHVAESIARALELQGEEKLHYLNAYRELTGHLLDLEQFESALLDFGEMARLLVLNTSYPAHSLDRLWYLHAWNDAAITLFEVRDEIANNQRHHLLELVFDVRSRRHFHGWENLARRLVSDFQYNTRTMTHLPEYKELWKNLRGQLSRRQTGPFFRLSSAAQ